MQEIFKDIKGYESLYQISNLGRIKSLKFNKEKILIPNKKRKGYLSILLYNKGLKGYYIHRLVAKAFISNPENKPCINHKNGIKSDNRIENLEWVTYSENNKHAYKIKLIDKKGEKNSNHKLEKKDILFIRKNKNKYFQKELAKIFNVNPVTISYILRYKTWNYL